MDQSSYRGGAVACVDGVVDTGDDEYPCHNIDVLSRVSMTELLSIHGVPGQEASDVWGWTSPNGDEIAIIGIDAGACFVDITDPINPVFLGTLPARATHEVWRDIKVYDHYAYIVGENPPGESPGHGLQVSHFRYPL